MEHSWQQEVDRFCHQYFQLETELDYPVGDCLRREKVQDEIYNRMFRQDKAGVGPSERYRVKTLKELIRRIESAIDDWDQHAVSDDIMSTLSALMTSPMPSEAISAQKKCFVTYHLSLLSTPSPASDQLHAPSPSPSITLLENHSLIAAGGTTGLRTWEAALHMGQYLCQEPQLVSGKNVLELGAGTGYLSILCVKHLRAARAIASDGSDDVINNLPDNLFLNGLLETSGVTPMDLKWGHALVGTEDEKWNAGKPIDVVLGADITYDGRVIPALITTLLDLFQLYPNVQVYISATERNADTYRAFLDVSKQRSLLVESLEYGVPARSKQRGPFYNDKVVIQLCRVSRI